MQQSCNLPLRFSSFNCLLLASLLGALTSVSSIASELKILEIDRCKNKEAQKLLEQGMGLQAEMETLDAIDKYQSCLKIEPCSGCAYEIGWSYWRLGDWDQVISQWNKNLKRNPKHPLIAQYLPSAVENKELVKKGGKSFKFNTKVEIGLESKPDGGPLKMILVSRRQSYNPKPTSALDIYDTGIHSPKSVLFDPSGSSVFVNSLEGFKTIAFDGLGLKELFSVTHKFSNLESDLFEKNLNFSYSFTAKNKKKNLFSGKPVELELSHGGKFLWIPFYRRSYDDLSHEPSAMALVDTSLKKIVKVYSTGPISKYVKVSPSNSILAVSHWGDNTVGLFDVRGDDFKNFKELRLLTIGEKLKADKLSGDRDRNCGFCVRGLAFSPDERYLFVTRMKGGGIAVFDLGSLPKNDPNTAATWDVKYLGSVMGAHPGPRDIHVSQKGEWLFLTDNATGYLSKLPLKLMIEKLTKKFEKEKAGDFEFSKKELGLKEIFVGLGARSLRLSPDEKFTFVAVNQTSELVAVQNDDMKIVGRIAVDSFPVGLDLNSKGDTIWLTSQGRGGLGGNSISQYQVRYLTQEVIQKSKKD